MKRIVVGTFAQCMSVVKKSERLGDAGYDYYEMEPSTDYERLRAGTVQSIGRKSSYHHESDRWRHQAKGNLFTLTLYRDNAAHKTTAAYNRSMKPLRT